MSGSPQRFASYHACFRETFARRMRYVHKITFLVAIFASFVLRLPYGNFWWNFVDSLWRVPLIFGAQWLILAARSHDSTVAYSAAKSLAEHIATSTILSRRFFRTLIFFVFSSLLVFAVFLTQLPLAQNYYVLAKEFRVKPAANDTWVYFWYHAVFAGFLYTFQHLVFQRNRLSVAYGEGENVFSQKPDTTLFAGSAHLAGSSMFFAAITAILAPFSYIFVRPLIYRLSWPALLVCGLDPSVPPLHIGGSAIMHVTFASFVLFLAWEVIGHAYNVYATIGCVDGKQAISARSADPMATILSGLRDTDPAHEIEKTTAYQELAYVACADDAYCVKTRNAFFNSGPSRAGPMWQAVLDECLSEIRHTAATINYRSKADMAALRLPVNVNVNGNGITTLNGEKETAVATQNLNQYQNESAIFGNSHESAANDTTELAVSAASSPLRKNPTFEPISSVGPTTPFNKVLARLGVFSQAWGRLNAYAEQIYKPHTAQQKTKLSAVVGALRTLLAQYYEQFLGSGVGFLFRTTAKRDAESRVPNPAIYACAVTALANLVKRAVEEDRSGTVTNTHISEALNALERPIRSSANYTDVLPASVYMPVSSSVSGAEKENGPKNSHLVAVMHDVTMTQFFQLCVRYNYKLDDLQLSARALKLAKWVLEVSAAHQQKSEKTQMGKLL